MAELVALRTILLNVLYKQANGDCLTAEEMQGLIERAATTTAAIRLSRTIMIVFRCSSPLRTSTKVPPIIARYVSSAPEVTLCEKP